MNTQPLEARILSQEVIHRIAAGEVVDRPASVLKELIENAVDAGATKVFVRVVDGGLQRIEVSDNGSGILKSSLERLLIRHTTSKIRSSDDLDRLGTLGFRGEALSAVASVSRLSIDSRALGQDLAWKLEAEGGLKKPLVPSARVSGTRVVVDDLFFNTPARLKFLKKSSSELAECKDVFLAQAMAHPSLSLQFEALRADGEIRSSMSLPPADHMTRFSMIHQSAVVPMHLELSRPFPEVPKVHLVALAPPHCANTQKSVVLIVNGRPIVDRRLAFSLREAAGGLIEQGRFPLATLWVEADPASVDVNVHPQKKEIRWPSHLSVPGLAYSMYADLLSRQSLRTQPTTSESINSFHPVVSTQAGLQFSGSQAQVSSFSISSASTIQSSGDGFPEAVVSTNSMAPRTVALTSSGAVQKTASHQTTNMPFRFSELRIVGELGAAWLLCENEVGLIVVDQHAAHERVRFDEEIKRLHQPQRIPLLLPLRVLVPDSCQEFYQELVPCLETLGFEVLAGSSNEHLDILSVPSLGRSIDWQDVFSRLCEDFSTRGFGDSLVQHLRVQVASSLACHGSVRRGQRLSVESIRALFASLDQVDWNGLCPHGRPVWISISHQDLEERFHRS